MYKPPSYLRTFRRKSPLTQRDVRLLLGSISTSDVCRVEKGQRPARIELLLIYHLLFNASIESFFELKCDLIEPELIKNCNELLNMLKRKPDKVKLDAFKIRFLEGVVWRLGGK